ncbi:cellulase family glycosylhydrolase [uncultured Eudoraea sp.]|uniref:glycoside hydrolase family 5 protein n=1 Tax=uncultured Eudoraea sp. TaxID=1035614 RepID=UPI00263A0CB0|nr:cellulase family glycosylhydrolase [uncultured Eudoraea sp.]
MKTLLILLFALSVGQCNEDEELLLVQEDKKLIENIEEGDLLENDKPLNWPWRGIVSSPRDTSVINERIIKELKTQGIDAIRLVVEVKRFSIKNNVSVEVGMDQHLQWVEKVIQWCAKEDIVVILHSKDFPLDPLKNFNHTSSEFWESEIELNAAISYINDLVLKFDKYPNVVAYDFFSEPVVKSIFGPKRPEIWFDFFNRILNTIRVHSNKYVVFSPGPWGMAKGYSDFKEPFDDNKIIYGFHFYNPDAYTHQGIKKRTEVFNYPGQIGKIYWDKNRIRDNMNVAVNWAKEHNKLLYVGEFSVVRWAEGKDQYLEDVLNVLEENKLGYTYHSLNNWKGWDMNYEEVIKGSKKLIKITEKTRTRQILENFWKLNGQ